jgi:hypothetical protein
MNDRDRLILWFQFVLSMFVLVVVFLMAGFYEFGWAGKLSADQDKAFTRFISWAESGAFLVFTYWLQRQRPGSPVDDADSHFVTQTHTLPDGTKIVTKTPSFRGVTNVTPPTSTGSPPLGGAGA